MRQFLVFKLGAIGDVLMTTPLVRLLSKEGRVDYLVGEGSASVLQNNPHIDRLYRFDETILLRRKLLKVLDVTRPVQSNRYDTVFVLDKHWFFSVLALRVKAALRVGFKRDAFTFLHKTVRFGNLLRHEVDNYLSLAGLVGLQAGGADRSLVCIPGASDRAHAAGLLARPYVVLCNGGGNNPGEQSDVRKMPSQLFGEIVRRITQRHHAVFLGLASEFDDYQKFTTEKTTNLCGKTQLMQAAAVLANAAGVITTDCGIMHMAGAVNARVLAVFGPTRPERLCPPGVRYLWEDEARYSFAYEDYGVVPKGPFYEAVDAARVVEAFENL